MSWFEEQIKERKKQDGEAFEESFLQIAGAILGRPMDDAFNRDAKVTADAVGEILKFYHIKPHEVPESMKDMNEVLEFLLRPHNIMRRNVRLEKGWYKDAIGAMLGTRKDDGSVVALLPYGLNGYRFYDRKTGRFVKINRRNEGLIETDAVAFYKPFPLKKMGVGSLLKYILEQISMSDIVILVLSMTAVTLVGMLLPKLNQVLFSDVLSSGSTRMLMGMGIFLICTTLSQMVFKIANALASSRITTKLDICVEAATMMRVLSLPVDFFRKNSAGELSNRVGYMNSLANQIISMALSTGITGLFSLIYITQIFRYAPALVSPAIVIMIVTMAVSVSTMFMQMQVSRRQMELSTRESGISYSMISGIQKIRLAGAEQRMFARWGKIYAESAKVLYNPPMFLKVSSVISLAVSLIGNMILYFAAVESKVSVADYYAFNSAYGMMSGAFMAIAGIATGVAQIKPVLEMVKPIMETAPEIDEEKSVVTKLKGGVELNNVTFRYSEDMPVVLDNISLKIRQGQYVAIVGKTGCGKSTLMRILLGFEKPQKGAVYYDGKDLKSLDPKSLRRNIGSVMQNGKAFMGSIYDNIVISAPWLTVDDAWEAAEIAGLADDIRRMPMGMNTLISEGAGGISGGQRQRLMIARAVAPKPRILLFDEATSALDNITQKKVSDSLDQMKCTRIVIAHRLSTIRHCDRIIVLDGGHIIEDGTYEELIEKNGFFAELVSRQRLDAVS